LQGEGVLALSIYAGDYPYIVLGFAGKRNWFSVYVQFYRFDVAYERFWNASEGIRSCAYGSIRVEAE
jgi:hypothetical protein